MAWQAIAAAAAQGLAQGAAAGAPNMPTLLTDNKIPFSGLFDSSGWIVATGGSKITNPTASGGRQTASQEMGGQSAPGVGSSGGGGLGGIGTDGIPAGWLIVGGLAVVLALRRRG